MALPSAGSSAIFRAAQKDEYFTKQLGGSASEVLRLFGNRKWHQYSKHIPTAAHLAYNSITTLRDFQTLGEEYTGIVQVDDSYIKIPSKLFQLLYILLGAFGESLIRRLLDKYKTNILNNKELLPEPKLFFLKAITVAQWSLPLLQELHQALFFLGGEHYHISKRTTGINYISAIPGRAPRVGSLRTLGIPYLLRAILNAVRSPPSFEAFQIKNKASATPTQYDSCGACLEENVSPCALPCGHVFCNACARSYKACVVCRAPYLAHRVVPLQNFNLSLVK